MNENCVKARELLWDLTGDDTLEGICTWCVSRGGGWGGS